jgi:hypothetical protein
MSDTETKPTTKSKRSSATKAKPKIDKYNGFKVPPKGRTATRWAIHIYDMMKEAKPELLQREDIKNAYNALIECLQEYDVTLTSWVPAKYNRYKDGIKPYKSSYAYFEGLPLRFNQEYEAYNKPDLKKQFQETSAKILKTYTPLYDLIKRDVVPYMELKLHETTSKKDIEFYHNQMEKLERTIKHYETGITDTRKLLCEYAQKCLKLSEPPVLTKFD